MNIKFPGSDPQALDLLKKMITFSPSDRISVDNALAHPYLASVRKPANEVLSPHALVMQIEEFDLSVARTKEFVIPN